MGVLRVYGNDRVSMARDGRKAIVLVRLDGVLYGSFSTISIYYLISVLCLLSPH